MALKIIEFIRASRMHVRMNVEVYVMYFHAHPGLACFAIS